MTLSLKWKQPVRDFSRTLPLPSQFNYVRSEHLPLHLFNLNSDWRQKISSTDDTDVCWVLFNVLPTAVIIHPKFTPPPSQKRKPFFYALAIISFWTIPFISISFLTVLYYFDIYSCMVISIFIGVTNKKAEIKIDTQILCELTQDIWSKNNCCLFESLFKIEIFSFLC